MFRRLPDNLKAPDDRTLQGFVTHNIIETEVGCSTQQEIHLRKDVAKIFKRLEGRLAPRLEYVVRRMEKATPALRARRFCRDTFQENRISRERQCRFLYREKFHKKIDITIDVCFTA